MECVALSHRYRIGFRYAAYAVDQTTFKRIRIGNRLAERTTPERSFPMRLFFCTLISAVLFRLRG